MIKEYRFCVAPEFADSENAWEPVSVALDLRFVSSASAYDPRGSEAPRWTLITLVGRSYPLCIGEEYTRFLRDWQSVKR